MLSPDGWTLHSAVALATVIEAFAPECGAHVALTGGCLYKTGERKDCDIVVYRIRQKEEIDQSKLFNLLRSHLGIEIVKDCGFCVKCRQGALPIDFLFPENDGTEYLT